jgi:hypothetical protein
MKKIVEPSAARALAPIPVAGENDRTSCTAESRTYAYRYTYELPLYPPCVVEGAVEAEQGLGGEQRPTQQALQSQWLPCSPAAT